MKRGGFIRRKPAGERSAYADRERDTPRMLWIKMLPCCARELLAGWGVGPCEGPVEADHAGRRALGRKAPDDTCIGLCTKHHRERTDMSGAFRNVPRAEMRERLDAMIRRYQNLYAADCAAAESP